MLNKIPHSSVHRFLKSQRSIQHTQVFRKLSSQSNRSNPFLGITAALAFTGGVGLLAARNDEHLREVVRSKLPTIFAESPWILGDENKNIVKDLEIGKDSGTASKLKILGGDETSEEVGVEKIAQVNEEENITEEKLEDVADKLVAAVEDVAEAVEATAEAVESGAEVVKAIAESSESIAEAVESASEGAESAVECVEMIDESVAKVAESVIETVKEAAETVEAAAETVEDAAETVEAGMESVESSVESVAETIVENIKETVEVVEEKIEAVEEAVEVAEEKVEVAKEAVSEVVEAVEEAVSEAVEAAKEAVSEEVEAAGEAVSEAVEAVSEAVEAVKEAVSEEVEAAGEAVSEKVGAVIETLEDAAETAVETVIEAVEGVFETIEAETATVEEVVNGSGEASTGKPLEDAEDTVETPSDEDAAFLRELDEDLAEKAATSTILRQFLSRGHSACEVAVETTDIAVNSVRSYMDTLTNFLANKSSSNEQENATLEVLGTTCSVQEKILEKALNLHAIASKEIVQIENVIQHVRQNPNFDVPEVEEAEEYLSKLRNVLFDSKVIINEKVDEITSQNRVLVHYRDLVGAEPVPFILASEEGLNSLGKSLSSDEQHQVIGHLHEYLQLLKTDITDERTSIDERLKKELQVAREFTEASMKEIMTEKMEVQIDALKGDFEKEKETINELHEIEIKTQLKRQAAAHVEHLTDALTYAQLKMSEKSKEELAFSLAEQATEYETVVAGITNKYDDEIERLNQSYALKLIAAKAKLDGFECAIDGRSVIDSYAKQSHELAIACEALLLQLRKGDRLSENDEITRLSISSELDNVLSACYENPAINAVIAALPTQVTVDGVFSEGSLRASFPRIAKLCCRLSLVNEEHNSLMVYALSFLKSLMMFNSEDMKPPTDIEESELDVFNIVSYANYCLQRGDVEQAARFVNQMKGEPKKVAENWLREARLYLETLHAVEALETISNAVVIGAQMNSN